MLCRFSPWDHDVLTMRHLNIPTSDLNVSSTLYSLGLLVLMGVTVSTGQAQVSAGVDDIQLSDVMPPGDPTRDAQEPSVAYSKSLDLYLVAWISDDAAYGLEPNETELFAQLFDPTDLTPVSSVLQVTQVGPSMDATRGVFRADSAAGPNDDFLLVWSADDANWGSIGNQAEVYSQRVSWDSGAGWSTTITRKLSDAAGMPIDTVRDATAPAVAWGGTLEEWLVVWRSDRKPAGLSLGEREIFGQRLDNTGSTVGSVVRLTHLGVLGDPQADADHPDLVYEPNGGRFYVVFHGDDVGIDWVDQHNEVFGMFVDADLAVIDPPDQLSAAGPTLDSGYDATEARVAVGPEASTLFVVWEATVDIAGFSSDKVDIWGRGLDLDGDPIGSQTWVGRMGDASDPDTIGVRPDVGWIAEGQQFLVTWIGNDVVPIPLEASGGPGTDVDYEIWGRSVNNPQGLGPRIQISDMGGDSGSPILYDALGVAIGIAPDRQALVAWQGDDDEGGQVDGEDEIFGELVLGNWIFVDGFESGDISAW